MPMDFNLNGILILRRDFNETIPPLVKFHASSEIELSQGIKNR